MGQMIASGQLGSLDDVHAKISTVQDVQALGLDRSGELVLSQLVLFRQDFCNFLHEFDERLGSMERLLCARDGRDGLQAQSPVREREEDELVHREREEDGLIHGEREEDEPAHGEREEMQGRDFASDSEYVDEPEGYDDEDGEVSANVGVRG